MNNVRPPKARDLKLDQTKTTGTLEMRQLLDIRIYRSRVIRCKKARQPPTYVKLEDDRIELVLLVLELAELGALHHQAALVRVVNAALLRNVLGSDRVVARDHAHLRVSGLEYLSLRSDIRTRGF